MLKGYDLDFLSIGDKSSGDSIFFRTLRDYKHESLMLIDGGYAGDAVNILKTMDEWYETREIQDMVLTHGDSDHINGLIALLESDENLTVGTLWALFPWNYSAELINDEYFKSRNSVKYLSDELKRVFKSLAKLEELAKARNITIKEPFAGEVINKFTVLSPTKEFYLSNIASSTKTASENLNREKTGMESLKEARSTVFKVIANIKMKASPWGEEIFPSEDTSAENNNSVILYTDYLDSNILLTGDAGKKAFDDLIKRKSNILNKIKTFQVPHHGSRRNLSSLILDSLFGNKIKKEAYNPKIKAVISAGKEDEHHPRNAVVRALMHRNIKVFTTKKSRYHDSMNAPDRKWKAATPLTYPATMEE
ncbi:TPA: ComEC/Rec2 family competence protein [Proteus mirabilis]